jgi:hypothetical protein
MFDNSAAMQLDCSIDTIEPTPFCVGRVDWLKSNSGSGAMCAFTVNLIDFDKLTSAQKRDLLKNLKTKKRTLEQQLKDANRSLKGIDRALGIMQKKTKRRA